VVLFRSGQRPIDHRNLISLTSGPDKYSPPTSDSHNSIEPSIGEEEISSWLKDVLKAQEARERKPADLNEQVLNLLDSFDHDQVNFMSQDGQVLGGTPTGGTKIKSLIDSHHPYSNHHTRITTTSKASFEGSDQSRIEIPLVIPDPPSKVPSLMATVLYPDRPPFTTSGLDSSPTRNPFDQQSTRARSSNSATSSTISPSIRGFSPARFSRPPYPRGSRW
jgi:hypothetical protein